MDGLPTQMQSHVQELAEATAALERFEIQEHRRLLDLDRDGRVTNGVSWSPVRVDSIEPVGRRFEVVVRGGLHEGIGPGARVEIGGARGRVRMAELDVAELLLDAEPDEAATEVLRLPDAGTLRRYREALDRVTPTPLALALVGDAPWPEATPMPGTDRLNASQHTALEWALQQPELAVIHGPPGTGKTHVIGTVLRRLVDEGDTPWALADSNAAVDHLARTARAAGLRVVRLGVLARMDPETVELSLEAWIERSPLAAAITALERELSLARSRRAGGRELGPLYDERRRLRAQAREWALEQAQVIATTFGTLVTQVGEQMRIPRARTAVVDEATQALEPAVWTAVPWVERLILVGDPHQLGPVVKLPGSPLQASLLERLLRERPVPMLEVQHRMAPPIHALVQQTYGEAYRPHPRIEGGEVWFVDTAGADNEEQRDPMSRSLYNVLEIALVQRAVERWRGREMVVLAPYSAQVQRLRAALPGVSVETINAYQGREAEVVFLSFVRANPEGELGFLADLRRLTVALSRAQQVLWMCGDSATLAGHPRFAQLLADVEQVGTLASVWEPEWTV